MPLRRSVPAFLATAFLGLGVDIASQPALHGAEPVDRARIPVILDTDIGDDIDDTWALALLLRSPEFDLKLVVGDKGKSQYRARLLAKLLQTAGRTDVPVGIGVDLNNGQGGRQEEWLQAYQLSD